MKAFFITVVVAALFIVALAFGARNEQMVQINYFIAQGEFLLSWVLAATFLAGFVISWLLALWVVTKQKFAIRQLKQRCRRLQSAEPDSEH
ncbi:LapA family protein [Ferrimonas marina]|uniref:LapA family protein n=1 Tax=Ferrimonas marina TaxID=299255 RepID=UPI00082DDABC|nr:lipopolysaccharide assembly protein LapA domain-containing protein [Ferrimonas marina]